MSNEGPVYLAIGAAVVAVLIFGYCYSAVDWFIHRVARRAYKQQLRTQILEHLTVAYPYVGHTPSCVGCMCDKHSIAMIRQEETRETIRLSMKGHA